MDVNQMFWVGGQVGCSSGLHGAHFYQNGLKAQCRNMCSGQVKVQPNYCYYYNNFLIDIDSCIQTFLGSLLAESLGH